MSVQQAGTDIRVLRELEDFPLVEALFGCRSRRFARGGEIPDGPLAYRSGHEPVPLSELERMPVLGAMGGTTRWHFSITRHARYAPHVSNYSAAAAGRTFPSAAGFHTAELFFTDDSGVYLFATRDAGALVDPATGREGGFEAYCPPHYPDMAAAVEAFAERKFGPGGPFHPGTPGAWTDGPRIRGSAQIHDPAFRACVATQAQYVFDTFGKFPGTVPSVFIMNYVQAHHLDLDFYDRFFKPGACLRTHAEHMQRWHGE